MGLSPRTVATRLFRLAVEVVELVLRVIFALPRMIASGLRIAGDVRKARRALRGGTLHCPIGHEVPTEQETYECASCGFVYGGKRASIWICGNPECGAITPYVSCPTCGVSCRNPYRWG